MRQLIPRNTFIIFQQNNARQHVSKITSRKIKDLGWEVFAHSLYSPDIAPTDFHLFRSLQHFMYGKRFENEDKIKEGIQSFIASKSISFFEKGIKLLVDKCHAIVNNNGEYMLDL